MIQSEVILAFIIAEKTEKKMSSDERLAYSLRMQFDLASHEPTAAQLRSIKTAIKLLQGSGKIPTKTDWSKVVALFCSTKGKQKTAGVDNSDLNTLLAMATQEANKKG